MSVIARSYEIDVCATCGERVSFSGNWCNALHPEGSKVIEVVPAEQLQGAVEAGDALADAVSDIMADDPESVLHTWVRRWRESAHPGGQ